MTHNRKIEQQAGTNNCQIISCFIQQVTNSKNKFIEVIFNQIALKSFYQTGYCNVDQLCLPDDNINSLIIGTRIQTHLKFIVTSVSYIFEGSFHPFGTIHYEFHITTIVGGGWVNLQKRIPTQLLDNLQIFAINIKYPYHFVKFTEKFAV